MTLPLTPLLAGLDAARLATADAVNPDDEVSVDDRGDQWDFEFIPQGDALGGGAPGFRWRRRGFGYCRSCGASERHPNDHSAGGMVQFPFGSSMALRIGRATHTRLHSRPVASLSIPACSRIRIVCVAVGAVTPNRLTARATVV
jgi:hypothetical protein